MTGLILRISGPMQSWGEHSAFNERDTLRFPSRSGLIGMFTSAQGLPRGASLDHHDQLRLTVRIDRPGTRMVDFHTIGGGRARKHTVPTPSGGRRDEGKTTILTKRHYLADAAFTVAVQGPDQLIDEIATALRRPHWPPYLGRRSCPPDQPLLLRAGLPDAEHDLRTHVPIPQWRGKATTLEFVTEETPGHDAVTTELNDVPENFDRFDRRYRTRSVSITATPMPPKLFVGRGKHYLDAVAAYMRETTP